MAGTWQRLDHVELSSSSSEIASNTFTAKDNLKIVLYHINTGGYVNPKIQFNGDSGSNYTLRYSDNGGSDSTSTSQSEVDLRAGELQSPAKTVIYVKNISNKQKLFTSHTIIQNTAGAGNVPARGEVSGKWTNTSAQITSLKFIKSASGSFASGSYVTVFGASDDVVSDEKDALTNVEVGTRYEETDTRKIYRRASAGTFTSTDYTTSNFTAVGSTVAITSNSAVSTNTPSNTANRVYATIPSLKSTDAWSCDFQLYVTEDATNDYHTIAFCTNSDAFNTSGQNHVSVQTQGGGYQRFVLNGRIGGSNSETTTSNSTRSLNTNYYITLSSDGANTARMRIWTNSNRTGDPAQDKTLSIANIGTLTTIMHGIRNATSSPYEWSGTVSNVSLTNPAKWVERGTA